MRKYWHIGVVLSTLLCTGTVWGQAAMAARAVEEIGAFSLQPINPPQPMPAALFFDEAGKPTYMANFKGKVVVLNLWATWCTPCVMEMPSLDKLQRRYKRAGLEVLPVAMEQNPEKVKSFMLQHRLRYLPVYFDPEQNLGPALSSSALPTSFIINRKGEIVARMDGADDWNSPEIRAKVEEILRENVPENVQLPQLNIKEIKPEKSGGVHLN